MVRGALLKGLAKSDPSSASMRVGSRAARKHYGTCRTTDFKSDIHSKSRRFFELGVQGVTDADNSSPDFGVTFMGNIGSKR